MMEIEVSLPLDEGYLRRECPTCERQFKWHHGPVDEAEHDGQEHHEYFCPYCGRGAGPDEWHTGEQVEFYLSAAAGPAIQEVSDALADAFRGSNKMTYKPGSIDHDHPAALHEPADMVIVEPPCHPKEPLKIDEHWTEAVHCLLCGAQFALG
jgi:hypothetical protein